MLLPRIKSLLLHITLLISILSVVVTAGCSQQPMAGAQTVPNQGPSAPVEPRQPASQPTDSAKGNAGPQPAGSSEIIVDESSPATITPTAELATTGSAPAVDIAGYRLKIEGRVDNPLSLTYDDIKKYPSVTGAILLVCTDLFTNNAQWTGVPVANLLDAAHIQPGATRITFSGIDGYTQTLSASAARDKGVFLAYLVNGQTLPPEQGFPLRLVVRGKTGNLWVKWVDHIVVN
jgi:DMSO/TMAO reductase YedYZ molybdopterin-dependent catalytic subunit